MKPGDEAPPLVVEEVDRAMFVRYAGASGDFNPIHWNEDFARQAGYPSVFGMGMFTAGVLARYLTDWVGAGNVRRYAVRFTGQVWPGDSLHCSGRVTDVRTEDGERLAEIELTVADGAGDRKVAGSATCVVPA